MKRPMALGVLAALVVCAVVGGVIAWLTTSDQVENQFELGQVTPVINEDGPTEGHPFEDGDNVKQNVDVTNKGNVPIYVRARVDIYWADANGNQLWEEPDVAAETPTGVILNGELYMGRNVYEDGKFEYALETGSWVKGPDGFYYWTQPLAAGASTDPLIDEFKLVYAPDGRTLVCDVSVQGIQAEPSDAVIEAWSTDAQTVSVDAATGKLTITEKTGE